VSACGVASGRHTGRVCTHAYRDSPVCPGLVTWLTDEKSKCMRCLLCVRVCVCVCERCQQFTAWDWWRLVALRVVEL
jgi:hypothetical protein